MLLREAAARRAARLHGLELLAVLDAAADFEDHFAQRGAHRHLDQADVIDLARQGEDFGALALFGADRGEPFGAPQDDGRNIGVGFDVVHIGRVALVARFARVRGFHGRFAASAFHRMNQRRLLAADEGARAVAQLDVEREARAQDVVAQQPVFPRLFDGSPEPFDGQRVFGADVDQSVRGARAVAVDGHRFEDRVGIAFEDRTVHECARIPFVGVADHVFAVGFRIARDLPLQAGGETASAAPPQAGVDDLLQHVVGLHAEHFGQGCVAVAGDVFADVLGVDEPAVPQGDAQLRLVELHVLAVGYVLPRVGGRVEQPLYLAAFDDMLPDDLFGVFGFDRDVEGVVGDHLDDRPLLAEAEAAGADHPCALGLSRSVERPAQGRDDLLAPRCPASRAAAYQDVVIDFCHRVGCLLKIRIVFLRFRCPARRSDLSPLSENSRIAGRSLCFDQAFGRFAPDDLPLDELRDALGSDMAVKNRPAARQRDFDGGFVLAVSGAAGLGYDAPDATGGQFFDECCEDRFGSGGDAAFVHRNPDLGQLIGCVAVFPDLEVGTQFFAHEAQFLRSVYFCHVFRSFRV